MDGYIAVIQHTDELERADAKKGSFWEVFKGTNLRRTEIVSASVRKHGV
jgi:SP family general alpha glucoside:H+ symporter-like MFS transporter